MGISQSTGNRRSSKGRVLARLLVLVILLAFPLYATAAGADDTVTFTGTQTIPVPPASNYAGSGGGDGWAVALSNNAVYNVFHHNPSTLSVACHLQVDASPCWVNSDNRPLAVRTIVDANGNNFATPGQPGLYLDQGNGHLYTFAMRTSDRTGGVVCIDTTGSGDDPAPYFCGFTALTAAGESSPGNSAISNMAVVGSRLYSFNFFSGAGSAGGDGRTENTLMCFDLKTANGCAGQPFGLSLGDGGTVSNSDFPPPAVAAIGTQVIVPITVNQQQELACYDASVANGVCGGSWPAAIPGGSYVSSAGAPFPLLSSNGTLKGVCLPYSTDPCYLLSGAATDTPAGMAQAVQQTTGWNGPAVVVGPRVYIPDGIRNAVDCYDYAQAAGCVGFPKAMSSLGLLYTVNADPQRPACLWVNADNGQSQIQNFDAFSGGGCGQGPIRVLASSFVVNAPNCTPGNYTSLQVTSPAPGAYKDGSVTFADPSGNAIPGASQVPLDATGTAALTGLNLNTSAGLPQFLITLNGTDGTPQQVVVKLTWVGKFDPSCAQGNTTIVNPPTTQQGTPASSDLAVSVGGPSYARVGQNVRFAAQVVNRGINNSTGVVLKLGIPAGATVVSASIDKGSCSTGASAVSCIVGTLVPSGVANASLVLSSAQPGSLTVPASASGDYDANPSNNSGTATTAILDPTAPPPPPPAPAQPGTWNAITVGTVTVNGVVLPPDTLFVLHPGDVVDITGGSITFTSVDGSFGTFSSAPPHARRISGVGHVAAAGPTSQFTVAPQAAAADPTTLKLSGGDFSVCSSPRSLQAKKKTVVRQLWGKASGHFRTQARYSSATIRGTVWLTEDRCDGSFTQAVVDSVDVNDLVKNTTVTISPGQSYLAVPKATFKPPKQVKHKKPKKHKAKKHHSKPLTYVVQNGDSLSSIATQQLGVEHRWVDIAKLNGLKPPYTVQPGTTIRLPKR